MGNASVNENVNKSQTQVCVCVGGGQQIKAGTKQVSCLGE